MIYGITEKKFLNESANPPLSNNSTNNAVCINKETKTINSYSISYSDKQLIECNKEGNSIYIYKTSINEKIITYTDEELNDMTYENAIRNDNRSFISLYVNYLKLKQPILNAFIVQTSTQLKSVKIAMLIITTSMSISFNALFFTENIQIKNYETNGNISWLVTFPKVVLSCIASIAISSLLSLISSYHRKIKLLKMKKKNEIKKDLPYSLYIIKAKLYVFFILVGAIVIFFWYFVTAFFAVFPKYQSLLIWDSLKSLVITMLFPLIYALNIALVRYIAIRKKSKCMFCFAKIINIVE